MIIANFTYTVHRVHQQNQSNHPTPTQLNPPSSDCRNLVQESKALALALTSERLCLWYKMVVACDCWVCIPLAVDTFGHWGKEAQNVFSRLASLLSIHQGRPKSVALFDIYSRMNMCLVRSVSRAIMGRVVALVCSVV